MDFNPYIPIYINKNLILDLYSVLINGYVDNLEEILLKNIDNIFRIQGSHRNAQGKDCKFTDPKDKNTFKDFSNALTKDDELTIDARNSNRKQIRIRKNFTIFQLFNVLKLLMEEKKLINANPNNFYTIKVGDYLELTGTISPLSLESQIVSVIDLLEAYGPKELDKLLPDSDNYKTNFTIILEQLKKLLEILKQNNTTCMIIVNPHFTTILNVNTNFFLDKNSYIYDNVNCKCNILCKVTKTSKDDENFNLLSKTCGEVYYSKLLDETARLLDILKLNKILVPDVFFYKINSPFIQAVPIAMYI